MKVFIDCGYYAGKALDYYAPLMDETWEVIAFEPNKDMWPTARLERFPFKVELRDEAVWIEDGQSDFMIGGRNDASHLEQLHPESLDKRIPVKTIDFSRFIGEFTEDTTIVVSMDIEGAEYPILRKMIKDGTMKGIALLDIEFHHRLVEKEDEATTSLLRRAVETEGTLVKLKVPLS